MHNFDITCVESRIHGPRDYYSKFITKYSILMDKNIASPKRNKAIDKQKAINDVKKVKEGKERVIKQFKSIP